MTITWVHSDSRKNITQKFTEASIHNEAWKKFERNVTKEILGERERERERERI